MIAGSAHIVSVLREVLGAGLHLDRVLTIPPGVDVEALRPRPRTEALTALVTESRRDAPNPPDRHDPRRPDDGNAERLAAIFADDTPTVLYVGKLSREKGVHLLLEALRGLDARAVIVGFGPERRALEQAAEGRVLFTGALEHRHLAQLWPLAAVSVTPSVFPEAFGMVAAEAAACGSPPLVARHSGLAEVAAGLAEEYPALRRDLTAFAPGDAGDLAAKLRTLLALSPDERAELGRAARRAAVRLWSWERIAARLLAGGSRLAALCGALTLGTLLAGYVVAAGIRGDVSSSSLIVFWGAAAILMGPLIGLAAHAVRFGAPTLAALGSGAMSGLLIGEGIYGLIYIADTTYPPYWWGELIVGVGLVGWIARQRFPRLRPIAVAAGFGLVVAAAFVAVYTQDLIAMLG
ncbi:MAG: glycosyltransferase family 4 protein [Gemmatimonadales bacterium]|nr:glycosyltransferase family 4 protein [Gemmatimonadales bacterium]